MQNNEGKNIQVNDVLVFKKNHPCGGDAWKVLRIGIDFKLECTTCHHQIMLSRLEVYKRIKKINKQEELS